MAIRTIPNVTINNSEKPFGGLIYDVNFKNNFSESPNELIISLISEDGNYNISKEDIQVVSPHSIKIGNTFNFSMYPITYEFSKSTSGRTLSITYWDTSIVLDKRIVLLKSLYGNITSGVNSCFILVGEETNNRFTNIDISRVPEITYTFNELITAIENNGIKINNRPNTNDFYRVNYVGTLRDVLSQICADYGFSFYWENNQIYFVDLTNRIQPNFNQFEQYVRESQNDLVTLENSIAQTIVVRFTKDGEQENISEKLQTSKVFSLITYQMLGFTDLDFDTMKAAWLGNAFYQGFLFNRAEYNLLGMKNVEPSSFVPNESNLSTTYQTKWKIEEFNDTEYEAFYNIFYNLSRFIGRFYFKSASYRTFSRYDFDGNVQWYPQNIKVRYTVLSSFLPEDDQDRQLDALLGFDDVLTTPDLSLVLGSNKNTALGNQGEEEYDPTDLGYIIYDAGEQTYLQENQNLSDLGLENFENKNPVIILPLGTNQNEKTAYVGQISDAPSDVEYQNLLDSLYNPEIDPKDLAPSNGYLDDSLEDTIRPRSVRLAAKYDYSLLSSSSYIIQATAATGYCKENVIKTELKDIQLSEDDLAFILNIDPSYMIYVTREQRQEALNKYAEFITYAILNPTESRNYILPFLDFPDNYQPKISDGVESFVINVSSQGLNSSYSIGNKLQKIPEPSTKFYNNKNSPIVISSIYNRARQFIQQQ